MLQAIAAAASCMVLLLLWTSVLRTIFASRNRGTLAARGATRMVAWPCLSVAARLRPRGRGWLLDLCAPAALLAMVGFWLVASVAAFTLLAWALYGIAVRPGALGSFFTLRSRGEVLAGAALLATALLLAAVTAHLVWFTDAHGRRERLTARLAGQVEHPSDAETVLADFVRAGSREHFDALFAEWAGWMVDVQATHASSPALAFARSASELCWIDAAVTVLDLAGMVQAVAPSWAPPHTRVLLNTGSRCLRHLATGLGLVVYLGPVNLQGREEQGFAESLKIVIAAGLQPERGESAAQRVFQQLRARYAPYGSALRVRLLYPPTEASRRGGVAQEHSP